MCYTWQHIMNCDTLKRKYLKCIQFYNLTTIKLFFTLLAMTKFQTKMSEVHINIIVHLLKLVCANGSAPVLNMTPNVPVSHSIANWQNQIYQPPVTAQGRTRSRTLSRMIANHCFKVCQSSVVTSQRCNIWWTIPDKLCSWQAESGFCHFSCVSCLLTV